MSLSDTIRPAWAALDCSGLRYSGSHPSGRANLLDHHAQVPAGNVRLNLRVKARLAGHLQAPLNRTGVVDDL